MSEPQEELKAMIHEHSQIMDSWPDLSPAQEARLAQVRTRIDELETEECKDDFASLDEMIERHRQLGRRLNRAVEWLRRSGQ